MLTRQLIRQLLIFDPQHQVTQGSRTIDLDILTTLRLIEPVGVVQNLISMTCWLPRGEYNYSFDAVEANAVSRDAAAAKRLLFPLLRGTWQLRENDRVTPYPLSLMRVRPRNKCRVIVSSQDSRCTPELLLCRMLLLALMRDIKDDLPIGPLTNPVK